MKLVYDKSYWDNYYDGTYEDTFQYGFPLDRILSTCWDKVFKERPSSFADIGSGPGHTLIVAERLMPNAEIYGVEAQTLPDIVHKGVVLADFLEVSKTLKPVDFLYVACSMYIPWHSQEYFISEVLRLTKKAVCFANVYLTDGEGIPEDSLRKVIYKDRESFAQAIPWKRISGKYDFFMAT